MPDFVVYVVGIPIIVYLLISVVTKARSLDRRIREHLEEEAKGPVDPYEQMVTLARVEEALQQQKRLQDQAKALVKGGKRKPPAPPAE